MKTRTFIALFSAALSLAATAHEGHSHEEAPPPTVGNAPRRLPDGSVYLPKAAQRQMGVLTQVVKTEAHARTLELPGKVVMDPHLGGRVQAMIPGRIEAVGHHGLPAMGSRVRKGETLAWVVPAASQIERSNQMALLAELRASLAVAEKRQARMRELADTVPRKDIESADAEVSSLAGRIKAVSGGLSNRDALVSPVSGILASANAVVGQVVEARELIFEVVNPDSLHIEASAYDALLPEQVAEASIALNGKTVPLNFIGASRRLREQTLPLIFENHDVGAGLSLPLGQVVKVQVKLKESHRGQALPARALTRNVANQTVVWLKKGPESFVPLPLQTQALDGLRVIAGPGLQDGARIVVQGAGLISQIR